MKNYKKKQEIEFPVCLIEFLLAPKHSECVHRSRIAKTVTLCGTSRIE